MLYTQSVSQSWVELYATHSITADTKLYIQNQGGYRVALAFGTSAPDEGDPYLIIDRPGGSNFWDGQDADGVWLRSLGSTTKTVIQT